MTTYADILNWIEQRLSTEFDETPIPVHPGATEIGRRFQLSDLEVRFLGLLLAVAENPSYQRQISFATGHEWTDRCVTSVAPELTVPFDAPVFRFGLVRAHETLGDLMLYVDPIVSRWAGGRGGLTPRLNGLVVPQPPPLIRFDTARDAAIIERMLRGANKPILVAVDDAKFAESFLGELAETIGLPMVRVDADLSNEQKLLLQRQAKHDELLIFWSVGGPSAYLPNFPIQFVRNEFEPDSRFLRIEIETPEPTQSELLGFLERHSLPAAVLRYPISEPELRDAILTQSDPIRVAKKTQHDRLGPFIDHIPHERKLADLVLGEQEANALEQAIREIQFKRTDRSVDLEFFPHHRRHIVLLHGPSGTGKTTAASVIAQALDIELYRVNIGGIVSKWIGETMKNLRMVIDSVAQLEGLVLFDEADALFAKRTSTDDAHDRYANTDSNYLLQLLDSFEGFAVLTSNRLQEVDPAFFRRFQQIIRFPSPDVDQQRLIWRRLLGRVAAESLVDVSDRIPTVATLTGAQIEAAVYSSVVTARSLAEQLTPRTLLDGVQRELFKTGDGLSARDLERVLGR